MLKQLSIDNIAVIKHIDVDFFSGFNVLTGETGAGKSILIDAINAVLGERTYKELIRNGCENAAVSAVFSADDSLLPVLNEMGIFADDNGDIIMQRTLNSQGRNVCKINGATVPLSELKTVGEYLINIHGQHDNGNLLNPVKHIEYLDKFADNSDLISDYHKSYIELKALKREQKELNDRLEESRKTYDLYEFQKREIEAANLKIGERDELSAKRDIAKNSQLINEKLTAALSAISGEEGALLGLRTASSSLTDVKNVVKKLGNADQKLLEFSYEIQEIERDIKSALSETDFSEAELESINERISAIDSLIRKYGGDEKYILEYYEKISKSLDELTDSDEVVKKLEDKISAVEDIVIEKAAKLTKSRKNAAIRFSNELCEVMKYLQMPNVRFEVDFSTGKYTGIGCDIVEFLISTNAGQPPKPLVKIASGGELSRIMLAIKSVFSKIDNVSTMIFDEIDTGISGIAADKVGTKLLDLSKDRQIICVTHLAQIAAKADNHFLIEKNMTSDTTETSLTHLDFNQRIREISRIISGDAPTENLLKTAEEMLNRK